MDSAGDLKCGCVIPEKLEPAIQFADIVARWPDSDTASSRLVAGLKDSEPLILPESVDYLHYLKDWKKLGNDRYGDCVSVAWANMRRLVTSKLSGQEKYPSMAQVMELYGTQNPTLDPENGMSTQAMLEYLVDNGGPDGVKAITYAQVNITPCLKEVRMALAIFGSLLIGMKVYPGTKDQFGYQQPWTSPKERVGMEGHTVVVGGYLPDSALKIVTWGETAQLTKDYANPHNIFEAWVVIWPEHLGSRRFMKGIDMKTLQNEFKKITEKDLPSLEQSLNSLYSREGNLSSKFFEIQTIQPDPTAKPENRYRTAPVITITPIPKRRAVDGIMNIDNNDLYIIRSFETASDFVELYRVLGPLHYEFESEKPTVTRFRCKGSEKGIFRIDNGDMYFIRYRDTNSGCVEIYFSTNQDRFQTIELYVTGFTIPLAKNLLEITVSGGDLYMITENDDGFLDVQCARGNANYSQSSIVCFKSGVSSNSFAENLNIGWNGDLYLINSINTESGKVEAWIATASSNYRQVQHFITSAEAKKIPKTVGVSAGPGRGSWIV